MGGLSATQRGFLDAVTAPAPARAAALVVGDARLGAAERIGVYARMYRDRLIDALAEDFPALRAVVGAEAFVALATGYVAAHPPRSWTLRDAGDRLAGYVAARLDTPAWWAELAALEWARVDAFDAADEPALARTDLAALDAEAWPTLRLAPVASARWLAFAHATDDVWAAVEDGHAPVEPAPCARHVVVWRRDLVVYHRALGADEAALAPALARGGTFAELCAAAAGVAPDREPAEVALAALLRWLDGGLLAGR